MVVCTDPGRWHYPDPNGAGASTSGLAADESSGDEDVEEIPAGHIARSVGAAAPYGIAASSEAPLAEALRAQLELCVALSRWHPFVQPSDEIVHAAETTTAAQAGWPCDKSPAERCQRRAAAVEELAYEEQSAQYMPPELRYQRTAKYRLSCKQTKARSMFPGRDDRSLLETGRHIDRHLVEETLRTPCARGKIAHGPGCVVCCGVRSFPLQDVLNWRVLWASLPASTRNQRLLEHAGRSLAGSEDTDGKRFIQYQFLGKNVCKVAFLALSGVGSSSLEAARIGALGGKQNCATFNELGLTRPLQATNKEHVYLGVRQWLEWYAANHAELSSTDFKAYLPTGRRINYYYPYRLDMLKPGRGQWPERSPLAVLLQQEAAETNVAGTVTFLRVWRWEVPWLIVHHCKCMFTACAVCSYLTLLVEQCPKSEWDRLTFLKDRLGQHFQWQASHRKQCPVSAFLFFSQVMSCQ